MNIQDFVGEIVFSKTDGKGRIEKVIWGKNTYFKVVFGNGTKGIQNSKGVLIRDIDRRKC